MPVTQEEIDAFNQIPVTPVGGQPIDPTGMLPQIPEVIAQDPTTMIPQLGSISPTFAEGTATLEDAGGTYPIIGDDIGVLQSAEGGLGEEDQFVQNEDLIDRGNPLGDSRIVPEEQETQGVPKTTFGTPVDFDQGFIDAKDFSATGTLADPLEKDDVLSGADVADPKGFLNRIGLKGFDPAEAFVKTAFNLAVGKPVTFFLDILKGLLPEQDPRVGMLDDFYTTGKGAQYMDPSSPNYIPGMENYNVVSGGLLNTITGGAAGDPTTYGLQEAYQDRIDTVENTLQDKYGLSAQDIADIKAGTFDPEKMDVQTDLVKRLVDLENAKAAEKKKLDLFAGDPEGDQPGMTIAENIALQNKAKAEADAIRLKNLTGDVDFDDYGTYQPPEATFDADTFDDKTGSEQPDIEFGGTVLDDDFESLVDTIPKSTGPIYNETTGTYEDAEGNIINDPNLVQELLDEVTGADYKIGIADKTAIAGLKSGFDPFTGNELTDKQKEEVQKGNYQKVIDELTGVKAKPISLDIIDTGDDKSQDPGPSGFVGLDEDMDVDPFEFDDYGIYEPPETPKDTGGDNKDDGPAPSAPSFDPGGGFVDTGGEGEFGGAPTVTGPTYGPHRGNNGGNGGGGCFLKGTLVTMADGSTKAIEQVDLGDNVAKGGKVFATGKFLVENLHDYKGIKVSGSHMVSEDGNWVRVEDSKHGKALGDDEHTVYVFGAENRRILINDILFTDYFEVNEQEKLSEGDKFFDNWKIHAKVDSDNNVNVLNAS
jgi:hypothetical protein